MTDNKEYLTDIIRVPRVLLDITYFCQVNNLFRSIDNKHSFILFQYQMEETFRPVIIYSIIRALQQLSY